MRVTDRMVYDAARLNASRERDKLQSAIQEASTGLKVVHPGDGPGAAGLLVRHRQWLERFKAIDEAAGRANERLGMADSAMQEMTNVVTRARELALALGNDNYDATERANAAKEVDQLIGQLQALGNTEVDGRYIFSGNKTDTPAFDAAGAYQGDAGVQQIEVAPGVLEDASVRGDVILKGAGGGVDVFGVLQSLATALRANDGAAIRGLSTSFDTATRQIASGLYQVGASMNAFDAAQTFSRFGQDAAEKALGNEQDADMFESARDLSLAQRALEATMTAAASSFKLTLLNKL